MSGVVAVEQSKKSERTGSAEGTAHLYKPSWVDYLTQWVRGLPGPWWSTYLVLAAVLVVPYVTIKWLYGEYANGFFPFHIVFCAEIAYVLAAMHLLDDIALRCSQAFRPVLNATDEEQRELRYQFTNMPWGRAWLATFFGVAFCTLMLLGLDEDYIRRLGMGAACFLRCLTGRFS
ncbi:MAG: hypothetical protein QOH93_168 [Chloroflexia bacterium]|jgi:hypothetical protein|nr:hypothetical protein [Chloroflexia bacterium]